MASEVYEQNKDYIDDRFEEAHEYADKGWDLCENFIHTLMHDFNVPLPLADIDFPATNPSFNSGGITRPTRPSTSMGEVTLPTAPTLDTLQEINLPVIPILQVQSPDINLPDAPDSTLPDDPGSAPNTSTVHLPTLPNFSLPPVPTFAEIIMPELPSIDVITFEGTFPSNDLHPPANMFAYNEAEYQSQLKDPLTAKILADIIQGGTGLDPATEEAIYLRARSRLSEERNVLHLEAANYFASRGHALPPGALQARLSEIDRKFMNSLTDINRDIIVKQAELTWQNIKETITAGVSREDSLMRHADNVANRAFEAAKYTVVAAVNIYNASVANYSAKLEGYKTQAMVFSERVKAQISQIEIYKASVEGKRIEADVQRTLTAVYQAQIEAVNSLIKVYTSQLQGAALEVEMNKVALEGYHSEIQAYVAKIGAKTAEFNMYQAQIAGEVAKESLYKEQVNAYEAEISAIKAQAEVNVTHLQAGIEKNKGLTSQYIAEVEGYKAVLAGNLAEVEANAKIYSADVDAYRADIQADVADMNGQIASYEAQVKEAIANSELNLKQAEINLQAAMREHTLQIEASKAGANVAAQIVSSALSSVNASASLGYRGGYSTTYSYDKTKGEASGASTINQHNWNET